MRNTERDEPYTTSQRPNPRFALVDRSWSFLNVDGLSIPRLYPPRLTVQSQRGFTLIGVIGLLAVIAVAAAVIAPNFAVTIEQDTRDAEDQHLRVIAQGIINYLRQHHRYPTTLASLSPDYLSYSATQLSLNERGFPRYYVVHPNMSSFVNATGLSASELGDARFLLISNLSQDASPTISTPSQFETWWTTDEGPIPQLKIYRGNVGKYFHPLTVTSEGSGASYSINGTATNSGGTTLSTRTNYHLTGTSIGLDEADAYSTPEVAFALTTMASYWFDPNCTTGKKWNPLQPNCGVPPGTIINGGFEDSPAFNGWSYAGTIGDIFDGNSSIIQEGTQLGMPPPEGSVQARLRTFSSAPNTVTSGADNGNLQSFMGLTNSQFNSKSGISIVEFVAIKQTISVDAGSQLSFQWDFGTMDNPGSGYNDVAFLYVTDNNGNEVQFTTLASVNGSSMTPGTLGSHTGYQTHTFNFPSAGSYTIHLGVAEHQSLSRTSYLYLDNFQTIIP